MVAMDHHRLKITSRSENIALVEKLINEVCESFKIGEDHYGNILVAMTEAVNNAIQHGNKFHPNKSIDISFDTVKDGISFTVKDQGEGFDFDHLPDPTDPENIEKLNGRGVFLMRHLADKVEYSDQGRTVSMDFKIS